MISYGKQTINQSDIDSVIKILKSDWLTQGPAVENFENDLKNIFGSKYACAVSNGTAALHLVAKVLNWSSFSFIGSFFFGKMKNSKQITEINLDYAETV